MLNRISACITAVLFFLPSLHVSDYGEALTGIKKGQHRNAAL